jgi:hypothetical protein
MMFFQFGLRRMSVQGQQRMVSIQKHCTGGIESKVHSRRARLSVANLTSIAWTNVQVSSRRFTSVVPVAFRAAFPVLPCNAESTCNTTSSNLPVESVASPLSLNLDGTGILGDDEDG